MHTLKEYVTFVFYSGYYDNLFIKLSMYNYID